jgi:hypothetical protein
MTVRDGDETIMELEATIDAPGFHLRARQTQPLKLSKLLRSKLFKGFPQLELPDIDIDDLSLDIYPDSDPIQYDFSLRFKEGLKVNNNSAALPYVRLSISNNEWSLYGSAEEKGFPIGELLESLAEKIGKTDTGERAPKNLILPETIRSFTVTSFNLRFRKATRGGAQKQNEYSFSCAGRLEVGGKKVSAGVNIDFAGEQKTYKGWLSIGTRMFSFTAGTTAGRDGAPESSQMVAAYSHWGGDALGFGELMESVINVDPPTKDTLDNLKIDLKDAFFAYSATDKPQKNSNYLFGVDLSAKLKFSEMSLVGEYFAATVKGGEIGVRNLQIVYAKEPFNSTQVTNLNNLFPANVTRLPDLTKSTKPSEPGQNNDSAIALKQGFNIAADLNLGFSSQPLAFPTPTDSLAPRPEQPTQDLPPTTPPGSTSGRVWARCSSGVSGENFRMAGCSFCSTPG